jgi:hypothetical protein
MSSTRLGTSAAALFLCIAPAAHAATDAELAEIRAQIRELRTQYETRIQALEQRLKEAEDRAAAATAAAPAPAPEPVAQASSPGASAAAFNPAISAILTGTYAHLSRDPADFRIAGFAPGGDAGPVKRGFGLGESELVLSANVDPMFAGNLTLAVTPEDTIAVEEAYGQWLTAPYGTNVKFGRFFSGVGYLNEQHAHAWDFVDAPLAYQALLGGQYAQDGVQARWIAPTEQFVELGAELGSGARFPGSDRDRNGAGSAAIFAHTGGDIGASQCWRAGLSWLTTHAEGRPLDAVTPSPSTNVAFTGKSDVAIADFVWKYAPNGNARETNAKIQGEYLWRRESGDLLGLPLASAYSSRQSGWYLQGLYQWHPEWRAGLRVERLDPGRIDYGANATFFEPVDFRPKRASAMVDFNPSEFSRIRLQVARSETTAGAADNQWFVQYILSLGAHGAHKY